MVTAERMKEIEQNQKNLLKDAEILKKVSKTEGTDIETNPEAILNILEDNRISNYKSIVKESFFKRKYLKLFYKIITTKDEIERQKLISSEEINEWIKIASKSREVDVVDDETGKILYSVPAMFGYSQVDEETLSSFSTNQIKNFSFSKLMNHWYNERKYSGVRANMILEKHLKAVEEFVLKDNSNKIKEMWVNIFSRYPNELNLNKETTVKENSNKEEKISKETNSINLEALEW